jgi:predicted DCC family thiol-disulfide oxidoreductase YuxK
VNQATPPAIDREVVFYDGHCGLCHRTVKWVLREDADGRRFILSPLQGEFIRTLIDEKQRAALPDSIIVRTTDGKLLTRSDAVIHILQRLGRSRRAAMLRVVPRPVRDLGYRIVARVRHMIFARPTEACPMMPPHLRDRFRW